MSATVKPRVSLGRGVALLSRMPRGAWPPPASWQAAQSHCASSPPKRAVLRVSPQRSQGRTLPAWSSLPWPAPSSRASARAAAYLGAAEPRREEAELGRAREEEEEEEEQGELAVEEVRRRAEEPRRPEALPERGERLAELAPPSGGERPDEWPEVHARLEEAHAEERPDDHEERPDDQAEGRCEEQREGSELEVQSEDRPERHCKEPREDRRPEGLLEERRRDHCEDSWEQARPEDLSEQHLEEQREDGRLKGQPEEKPKVRCEEPRVNTPSQGQLEEWAESHYEEDDQQARRPMDRPEEVRGDDWPKEPAKRPEECCEELREGGPPDGQPEAERSEEQQEEERLEEHCELKRQDERPEVEQELQPEQRSEEQWKEGRVEPREDEQLEGRSEERREELLEAHRPDGLPEEQPELQQEEEGLLEEALHEHREEQRAEEGQLEDRPKDRGQELQEDPQPKGLPEDQSEERGWGQEEVHRPEGRPEDRPEEQREELRVDERPEDQPECPGGEEREEAGLEAGADRQLDERPEEMREANLGERPEEERPEELCEERADDQPERCPERYPEEIPKDQQSEWLDWLLEPELETLVEEDQKAPELELPPEQQAEVRPEPQPEPPPERNSSPEPRVPEQVEPQPEQQPLEEPPPPPPPLPVAPRPRPNAAKAAAAQDARPVGLLYHQDMALHRCLNDMEHIENPKRVVRIFERLEKEGLAARCERVPCRKATREELSLKHTREHVDRIARVQELSPKQALEEARKYNSLFLCPQSTKAGLLSAGSVIEATARVCAGTLHSAICVVRPPGHHAERTHPMGFCLFGNVALAVAQARRKGWSSRTLIVDWDLHHGNGTQRMFEEDDSVLYFSFHRHDEGNFYPRGNYGHYLSHGKGQGAGYSVNVPWDVKGGQREGVLSPGDAECREVFRRLLLPLAEAFEPDLVLVSAGFDAAEGDPIGECRVTPAGYFEMTRSLMNLAGGRLVLALEGGYGLEGISASMAACAHALLGDESPALVGNLQEQADPFHMQTLDKVRRHISKFWPSLRAVELGEDGGEASPHSPSGEAELPAASLEGDDVGMMQSLLRQHAQETGVNYEGLRRRQEAILFKLDQIPSPLELCGGNLRLSALRRSFARTAAQKPPYTVPVLHAAAEEQAVRNVQLALSAGAQGVWLVARGRTAKQTDGADPQENLRVLAACFAAAREALPMAWLGVCAPQLQAAEVFAWVAEFCPTANAVWLEDLPCQPALVCWDQQRRRAARIERWLGVNDRQDEIEAIRAARGRSGWLGLVFGSVAYGRLDKVHHEQDEYWSMGEACQAVLQQWALLAAAVCDVVLTGGPSLGEPCSSLKVFAMEAARPLAFVGGRVHTAGERDCTCVADVAVATAACVGADRKRGAASLVEFDSGKLREWVARWSPTPEG